MRGQVPGWIAAGLTDRSPGGRVHDRSGGVSRPVPSISTGGKKAHSGAAGAGAREYFRGRERELLGPPAQSRLTGPQSDGGLATPDDALRLDAGSLGAADQLASTLDSGAAVTLEVVRRYFGGRADVRGYEIADAAIEGRINVALEHARWAETAKVAPVLVTSALAAGLRQLARLADAPPRLSEGELARHVGAPPFKVRVLRRQLQGWEPAGLARALDAVARADLDVKGGSAEPAYAVERMVLQVAAARRR